MYAVVVRPIGLYGNKHYIENRLRKMKSFAMFLVLTYIIMAIFTGLYNDGYLMNWTVATMLGVSCL